MILSSPDPDGKTHTTPKSDNSVHYGEFCLRISDDSQWTSFTPGTQQPPKSAHPTKQPTLPRKRQHKVFKNKPTTQQTHPDSQPNQPLTKPIPTYSESNQLPEQTTDPDLPIVTQEPSEIVVPLMALLVAHAPGEIIFLKRCKPAVVQSCILMFL